MAVRCCAHLHAGNSDHPPDGNPLYVVLFKKKMEGGKLVNRAFSPWGVHFWGIMVSVQTAIMAPEHPKNSLGGCLWLTQRH